VKPVKALKERLCSPKFPKNPEIFNLNRAVEITSADADGDQRLATASSRRNGYTMTAET
jgi:hypothetical protein